MSNPERTSVYVENKTGMIMENIEFSHRYDNDSHDAGHLQILDKDKKSLIGIATYWTGYLRTGYDYWWVCFQADGKKYMCKSNFYCYLTDDDAKSEMPVTIELTTSEIKVVPPKSRSCTAHLYELSSLHDLITKEHEASGVASDNQPEDLTKKSCMKGSLE